MMVKGPQLLIVGEREYNRRMAARRRGGLPLSSGDEGELLFVRSDFHDFSRE